MAAGKAAGGRRPGGASADDNTAGRHPTTASRSHLSAEPLSSTVADGQDPVERPLPDDPDELADYITQRREHLAQTLDALRVQARPDRIVRRTGRNAAADVRRSLVNEDGRLRTERVLALAAGVSALAALALYTGYRHRTRR